MQDIEFLLSVQLDNYIEIHIKREIHIHKKPCITFFSYFNIVVCERPYSKKKLTNNLGLRSVNALLVIY